LFPRTAAIAAFALGIAASASPCSIRADPDVPFNHDHFVFYGEVTGYASVDVDRCGFDYLAEGKRCPAAWGPIIRILVPVQVPAGGTTHVEYFPFGIGSACEDIPAGQKSIEKGFPVGLRVKVLARPFESRAPERDAVRLVALGPTIESISNFPQEADVKKLAAGKFDYAANYRRLVRIDEQWRRREGLAFEIWRDKQRLSRAGSETRALNDLLRMGAAGDLGVIAEDDEDSPIEKLAAQYLPTAAFRDELARRLRDAQYANGVMSREEMLDVAGERARRGDPRAMLDYGLLLHVKPMDDPTRLTQPQIDRWILLSAKAGHLPAIAEWFDRTDDLEEDDPVRREAIDWFRSGESRAMRAAARRDPSAYLFLADLYSTRANDADEDADKAALTRRARKYSCLLEAHPEANYWRNLATSAWYYVDCSSEDESR
jgi:hypothetical protein